MKEGSTKSLSFISDQMEGNEIIGTFVPGTAMES
jgi:hypothetical protein